MDEKLYLTLTDKQVCYLFSFHFRLVTLNTLNIVLNLFTCHIFDHVLRIYPDFTVRHLAGFSGKRDDARLCCTGVRDD